MKYLANEVYIKDHKLYSAHYVIDGTAAALNWMCWAVGQHIGKHDFKVSVGWGRFAPPEIERTEWGWSERSFENVELSGELMTVVYEWDRYLRQLQEFKDLDAIRIWMAEHNKKMENGRIIIGEGLVDIV